MVYQVAEKLTPHNHYQGRNGHPVEALVIHVAEGSEPGVTSWFHNPASSASTQYLICKDGRVIRYVRDEDTAWANGVVREPNLADPLIRKWVENGIDPNRCTIAIETTSTLYARVYRPLGLTTLPGAHRATNGRAARGLTGRLTGHILPRIVRAMCVVGGKESATLRAYPSVCSGWQRSMVDHAALPQLRDAVLCTSRYVLPEANYRTGSRSMGTGEGCADRTPPPYTWTLVASAGRKYDE